MVKNPKKPQTSKTAGFSAPIIIIAATIAGALADTPIKGVDQKTVLGKECGTVEALNYKPGVCNQERFLSAGNSVHTLHAQYLDRKYKQVKEELELAAQKKAQTSKRNAGQTMTVDQLMDQYIKDSTCLPKDQGKHQVCLDRLKRSALDAAIGTREATLKGNLSRKEIMGREGDQLIKAPDAAKNPPPDLGASDDKSKKSETVLKDFRAYTKPEKPGQLPPILSKPQTVNFNDPEPQPQAGANIEDAYKNKLEEAEVFDAAKVPVVTKLNDDDKVLDVSSTKEDKKINAALAAKQKVLLPGVKQDQKDLTTAWKNKGKIDDDSVSAEVFTSLIDDYEKEAQKDEAKTSGSKKPSPNAIDNKEAKQVISETNPGAKKMAPPGGALTPEEQKAQANKPQPLDRLLIESITNH